MPLPPHKLIKVARELVGMATLHSLEFDLPRAGKWEVSASPNTHTSFAVALPLWCCMNKFSVPNNVGCEKIPWAYGETMTRRSEL